jgi:glycosyltransferase involved in cell wall biosynthesis
MTPRRLAAGLIGGYARELVGKRRIFSRIRRQTDILHLNRIGCEVDAIAARSVGMRRIVGTLHVMPGTGAEPNHPVRRFIEWLSLRSAARLIAISEAVAEAWARRVRLPRRRFEVIYDGVDLETRDQALLRPLEAGAGGRPVIITTGRLHHLKGIDDLLRAMTKLDSTKEAQAYLLIVGDGPARSALERQAVALRLEGRVRFIGQVAEVYSWLATSSIFVSASRYEGMSLSLAEAMACGLPCVVTDSGGMPELVRKSGGGMIVPVGDSAALAGALDAYLSDPEMRKRDGAKARRFAEQQLDARMMAVRTSAVYRSLMKKVRR